MSDQEDHGIHPMPDDLYIPHQADFVRRVPELVRQLKQRMPALAWQLDLSPKSLGILDDYLNRVTDTMIARRLDIAETIDRDLILEVTAYVGETIRHQKQGRWQLSVERANQGPYIVFAIASDDESKIRDKSVGVYNEVLACIVEGESLAQWYEYETE